MVRKPVTSHAPRSNAGELVSRAISADTIKMPEPIIEPMTSVVALVRPSPFTNSLSPPVRETVFVSVLKEPLESGRCLRKNLHEKPQEFLCRASRRTQQVRDDCYRIGPRLDHRLRVLARDASDHHQPLPRSD